MAGPKNVYNAEPAEVVLVALEQANGVSFQRQYVNVTLVPSGPNNLNVTVAPRLVGGYSPYVDAITFGMRKLNLAARMPRDMCYSGDWPITLAGFASFMMTCYGLLIKSGQWELVHGSTVYPLDGSVTIEPSLSTNRFLNLRPTAAHPLFTPDMVLRIMVTQTQGAMAPLALSLTAQAEGEINDPVNITWVPSGGVAPYAITHTGTLPAAYNSNRTGLTGFYSTAGVFNYTIIVTDSIGQVASRSYSTEVVLASFVLANSAPDLMVTESLVHAYELDGGLPPYSLLSTTGLPMNVRLTSAGDLLGRPDVGNHSFSATFADSVNQRYRLYDNVAVSARDEHAVRVDLMENFTDLLDLSAGLATVSEPLKSFPAGSAWVASGLGYTNERGAMAGAIKINTGFLYKTSNQDDMDDIAVAIWARKGMVSPNGCLFSCISPQTGFEVRSGDTYDHQVRVVAIIEGQYYSFLSDPTIEVLTDEPALITVQAAEGVLSLHRNTTLIGWMAIPEGTGNILPNSPFTVGRQSNHVTGYQWNGAFSQVWVFRKRLWLDAIEWLYNTNHGRTYRELFDEFGPSMNFSDVMNPGVVGQAYYDEITVNGQMLERGPLRMSGVLPSGLTLTAPTPTTWVVSGVPTGPGTFQSFWACKGQYESRGTTIAIAITA